MSKEKQPTSREIARELTRDSATSQNVLVQVLENLRDTNQDGYFTIKLGEKSIEARQLG